MLSILIFLLGATCAAFGVLQYGIIDETVQADFTTFSVDKSSFGLVTMCAGGLAVIIGCLGCCTGRCKKPVFAVPFILLTFIVGIVILVMGILMMGIGGIATDKVRDLACEQATDINIQYMVTVDKFVCSKTCPCPKGPNNEYENMWNGYGLDTLMAHNRVVNEGDLNTNQQVSFRYYGDLADVTPLRWANNDEQSFSNFETCYNDRLKRMMEDSNNEKYADAQKFFS